MSPAQLPIDTARPYADDAAWLRAARARLGLSQVELANALAVTQQTLSKIETGARRLTRRTRWQVEQLLATRRR